MIFTKGLCYEKLKKGNQSIEYYDKAIRINPKYFDA